MPNPVTDHSLRNTLLLIGILIISFFPSLFHYLWYTPLYLCAVAITPKAELQSPRRYVNGVPPSQPQTNLPTAHTNTMSWFQKTLTLPPSARGSYLVTDQIVSQLPELKNYKVGMVNLFVQHTSCALSLNENWDSDVREDMTEALERVVPYDDKGVLYRHSAEGRDDMPAHVKSALIGASVSIPISNGKLALGTWQGIWYLEFREAKHTRKIVATIQGEKK